MPRLVPNANPTLKPTPTPTTTPIPLPHTPTPYPYPNPKPNPKPNPRRNPNPNLNPNVSLTLTRMVCEPMTFGSSVGAQIFSLKKSWNIQSIGLSSKKRSACVTKFAETYSWCDGCNNCHIHGWLPPH